MRGAGNGYVPEVGNGCAEGAFDLSPHRSRSDIVHREERSPRVVERERTSGK